MSIKKWQMERKENCNNLLQSNQSKQTYLVNPVTPEEAFQLL